MRKTVTNFYNEGDTKKIVHDELRAFKDNIVDEITSKVDRSMTKIKDEILTALDENTGELKAMREEQTLIGQKLSEHSDDLEDHEGRIKKIEKFPQVRI